MLGGMNKWRSNSGGPAHSEGFGFGISLMSGAEGHAEKIVTLVYMFNLS